MKALIFDMDGVITDSELHWQDEEQALLKKLVPGWTKKDHGKILGLTIEAIYERLKKQYGLLMPRKKFMEKVDRIATHIYREQANLIEGFLEFIKKAKKQWPTALCSSSRRSWIETLLHRHDLHPLFDVVVSFEDIGSSPGKPAPDIYLFTAKKLGVKPADCVVIEDSENGVLSARAAGMFVIGLKNGFNHHQDLSGANVEAKGFKEVATTLTRQYAFFSGS